MGAEIRRAIEEKNKAEAAKADLERDNNNLKVVFDDINASLHFLYSVALGLPKACIV